MNTVIIRLISFALLLVGLTAWAQEPAVQDSLDLSTGTGRSSQILPPGITGREPMWDTDSLPGYITDDNPFRMLALMVAFEHPVLDHRGKPHRHGNIVQIIEDGGNGRQDEPRPDGSPGGDDSLAFGNFNMFRIWGLEMPSDSAAATGLFWSRRYFVPYIESRRYYLRVWEGNDLKTAPYYQDSREYKSETDQGGAMYFMRSNSMPTDVEWQFGPAKPRPKS